MFSSLNYSENSCENKKCGEECGRSVGLLQVMRYCQPDGSCEMNMNPNCEGMYTGYFLGVILPCKVTFWTCVKAEGATGTIHKGYDLRSWFFMFTQILTTGIFGLNNSWRLFWYKTDCCLRFLTTFFNSRFQLFIFFPKSKQIVTWPHQSIFRVN